MTTTCQSLNKFANDTNHIITAYLFDLCKEVQATDSTVPDTAWTSRHTDQTTAPPGHPETTESMSCVREKGDFDDCTRDVRDKLETFTAVDWRNDAKIEALCRQAIPPTKCRFEIPRMYIISSHVCYIGYSSS